MGEPGTPFADVPERLQRYSARTMPVIERYLPRAEPSSYLHDLVRDYPTRGGKSVRASICLAAAGAAGGRVEDAIPTAASLEILHNAFLIHDDIEDESDTRRGSPTLHIDHGVPLAINAGDATAMLAIRPLLDQGALLGGSLSRSILHEFQVMTERTVAGQALELGWRRDNVVDLTPRDYLRMVLGKTCWYTTVYPLRVGALIGSANRVDPDRFLEFGSSLGALFQIADDVQNLEPSDASYGKEYLGDIFEGKRTLPLIHLLNNADADRRAALVAFLATQRCERSLADAEAILHDMRTSGSVDWTRTYARALGDTAQRSFSDAFAGFPPNEHADFLRDLIGFLIDRLY